MAVIEKRSGRFGVRWRVRIRKPNLPTITRTFGYKADAETWARQTERSLESGTYNTNPNHETLGDLIIRYADTVSVTKKGTEPERIRLMKIARHTVGKLPIAQLKSLHFAQYRDQRLKEVSPSTVKKELNLLSHVIDTARKEWNYYIPHNPISGVRRPKENRARDRRLSHRETLLLLDSCRLSSNPWLSPLVIFAIETGMRRGELLGLRWENINLQKRTCHLSMTKNGSSRNIPLSSHALETLNDLPRNLSGVVFPVSPIALRGLWRRACKRVCIEDFRFHDLRHEATSRLFEKGLNVMEVASITGHKDLRMLQRYTHLRAEDLVEKLG